MSDKRPNNALTSMFYVGAFLLVIGTIVWLYNTDFDYHAAALAPGIDDTNPNGQTIGYAMGSIGTVLLVLGWTAAAIVKGLAPKE